MAGFGRDGTIRIVRGTATGPTEVASYDAALADAGLGAYNLATVSSIIPAGAEIERVGTAPDLGPAGNRLTVVQARGTVERSGWATAALGWTRGEESGVFYEEGGRFETAEAERRVREGLDHARELRGWEPDGAEIEVASQAAGDAAFATAVVLAAYGTSEPIL